MQVFVSVLSCIGLSRRTCGHSTFCWVVLLKRRNKEQGLASSHWKVNWEENVVKNILANQMQGPTKGQWQRQYFGLHVAGEQGKRDELEEMTRMRIRRGEGRRRGRLLLVWDSFLSCPFPLLYFACSPRTHQNQNWLPTLCVIIICGLTKPLSKRPGQARTRQKNKRYIHRKNKHLALETSRLFPSTLVSEDKFYKCAVPILVVICFVLWGFTIIIALTDE